MSELDDDINALQELIKILDEVHSKADPNAGLFLKTAGEKIAGLKQNAEALLNELQGKGASSEIQATASSVEGQTLVYVSLFQTDPESIDKWQKTLRRISEYSLARPIYRKVEHIEQMIRSRPDPRKEAYVAVWIRDDDVISGYAGKMAQDQMGNDLVTVKEGAVKPENIKQFVHGDIAYTYREGTLSEA